MNGRRAAAVSFTFLAVVLGLVITSTEATKGEFSQAVAGTHAMSKSSKPSADALVSFVKNGSPRLLDSRAALGIQRQGNGYLEIRSATIKDAPQYYQHYISIGARAARFLAEGDFHIRTRLGLAKQNEFPGPVVLSLQIGLQFYDFVFKDGMIALQGIQLDAVRYEPGDKASRPVALNGEPFTLELTRQSGRVEIRVNGKVLTTRVLMWY